MAFTKIEKLSKKLKSNFVLNYDTSLLAWFKTGGKADIFCLVSDEEELEIILNEIGNMPIFVIGAGSNILIRDGGFNGIIIKLGKFFSHLSLFDKNTIIAGTSSLDKNVSNFALKHSLSKFEFLSCIPGTIGGGIRMNTGCYGEDISKILLSVQAMDLEGKIKIIYSKDIKFSYRKCNLDNNLIFISATLRGSKENKLNIKKKINYLVERKKKDQPSQVKTCGSTFKNPDNTKAWQLIKASGCAGMIEGDAYISKKHCNFFVNKKNANSQDLEKLIYKVKKKVFNQTGINLELEIQIIGEKLWKI